LTLNQHLTGFLILQRHLAGLDRFGTLAPTEKLVRLEKFARTHTRFAPTKTFHLSPAVPEVSMRDEDAFTKQFDWQLTQRIFKYLRPYLWAVVVALLLALIGSVTNRMYPYLQGLVIDNYLKPVAGSSFTKLTLDERWNGIVLIGITIAVIAILEFAARYAFNYLLTWMGQNVLFDVRADLFAKLQRLPLAYFDRNPVGRLITRVTSDVDAINNFITDGLMTMVSSVFVVTGTAVLMFLLNPKLALVTLAVVPILFVALRFFQTQFRLAYREIRIKQAIVNTYLNENITGMGTVQIFNREARNKRDFDTLNKDFRGAYLNSVKWYSYFFPTVGIIGQFALAVVIWVGGGDAVSGAVTIGTLYAFTRYVFDFFHPLEDLSNVLNTLQAAMASAERIFGILDEPEVVTDKENAKVLEGGFRGEVMFKDVWFSYKPVGEKVTAQDWVLRGINFHVKPGESVAFVGATGAGKTSVISLISRFYDIQQGSVTVDGVDVRDYRQRDLRKHIGVVLQDVYLFSGTFESNLRMNDESIPFERIVQACKYVGVDEFIMSLPDGYKTEVRERGATLSTGQKQLLAFARALIQNPDILLVLDEATANIDTESELQIQDALAKVMHGRTSIVIAHRLSTIKNCDRIIVMRKGKIVEEGNHAQLLEQNGYYAKLYKLQYADQELIGS
jgi:ATP-binding cassette, subfamily B, multidrug efflux pump